MNRERARELLPIIEAFANGEEIESKFDQEDSWAEVIVATFEMSGYKYRIKPKPKRDKKYLDWFARQNFTCCICSDTPAFGHHVKEFSSDLKNDHLMLPLCLSCHTGNKFSAHGTPRLFRQEYNIIDQKFDAIKYYEKYLDE